MKKCILVMIAIIISIFCACEKQSQNHEAGESLTTVSITETLWQTISTDPTIPDTKPEADGVELYMPDSILITGCIDSNSDIMIKRVENNTIRYVYANGCIEEVVLDEEEIKKLNAMYEAVTDFSANDDWISTSEVIMRHDGKVSTFGLGCANQAELNDYIDNLLALS